MAEHSLDPLLQPSSIALLGASERADSPGSILAGMIINSEYQGEVFPVNPGYSQILGLQCYPHLDSLPKTVDHVVIALGNAHLEAALRAAIEHGARPHMIFPTEGKVLRWAEPGRRRAFVGRSGHAPGTVTERTIRTSGAGGLVETGSVKHPGQDRKSVV